MALKQQLLFLSSDGCVGEPGGRFPCTFPGLFQVSAKSRCLEEPGMVFKGLGCRSPP